MPGVRHHRRVMTQLHLKSLLAFLVGIWPASREPFLNIMLAAIAPQFSELAKQALLDSGISREGVINPNPAGEYLLGLVVADYRREFLENVQRRSLAYSLSAPSGGEYPREAVAAVVANVYGVLDGSYQETARFLNEGIPTRDMKAHGLTGKNVWDACRTYRRMLTEHVKASGANFDDLKRLSFCEGDDVLTLLELYRAARNVDALKSLWGAELARALAARDDFTARLSDAGGLVWLKKQGADPFRSGGVAENTAAPDAAELPNSRRGRHAKRTT